MKNRRAQGFGLPGAFLLGAVAGALLLPAFSPPTNCSQRIKCVNNERQLGIAFHGFKMDAGTFPMQTPVTNTPANPLPL